MQGGTTVSIKRKYVEMKQGPSNTLPEETTPMELPEDFDNIPLDLQIPDSKNWLNLSMLGSRLTKAG